ncbi:uncharacterized protein LOC120680541 [Panicum virgatum]|nr:uncharacterized protein LOC120680541 [Panicum virgatum]
MAQMGVGRVSPSGRRTGPLLKTIKLLWIDGLDLLGPRVERVDPPYRRRRRRGHSSLAPSRDTGPAEAASRTAAAPHLSRPLQAAVVAGQRGATGSRFQVAPGAQAPLGPPVPPPPAKAAAERGLPEVLKFSVAQDFWLGFL